MEEIRVPYGRRCWAEVDLRQIRQNLSGFREKLPRGVRVMAVVKANAYGHGDVQVARTAWAEGVRDFAVSNVEEAVRLRKGGIGGDILILGYTPVSEAGLLTEYHLTQALLDEPYARALASAARGEIRCHYALDTGMRRIGLNADEPEKAAQAVLDVPAPLTVTGLFTHLCAADTPEDQETVRFTHEQQEKAARVLTLLRGRGRKDLILHTLNSAAGLYQPLGPSAFARLGIVLYGLRPDRSNVLPDGVRPALSWKTVIAMVKTVRAGDTVGYGRTWRADAERTVATLPVGYADGLDRALSSRGYVLVNGRRAPILGRVCMDQTMVDVTGIPGTVPGAQAVILGQSGAETQTADDMAEQLSSIGYEIVCRISARVPRIYLNGQHDDAPQQLQEE